MNANTERDWNVDPIRKCVWLLSSRREIAENDMPQLYHVYLIDGGTFTLLLTDARLKSL